MQHIVAIWEAIVLLSQIFVFFIKTLPLSTSQDIRLKVILCLNDLINLIWFIIIVVYQYRFTCFLPEVNWDVCWLEQWTQDKDIISGRYKIKGLCQQVSMLQKYMLIWGHLKWRKCALTVIHNTKETRKCFTVLYNDKSKTPQTGTHTHTHVIHICILTPTLFDMWRHWMAVSVSGM